MVSNYGLRLQYGILASLISMNTSTLLVFSSISLKVLFICPGNQLILSFKFLITFITQIFDYDNLNSIMKQL